MTTAAVQPSQILNSYRKSDAVIIVCQNNTKKIIEIAAVNEEAALVTGFSNEELLGQPLAHILPERLASTVAEFVEFKPDENDLLAVLNKIRNFSVKSRAGNEVEFKLRIIRGESIDNNPLFHLVLVDEEKIRKANAFRQMLQENFKGHEVLNETTGLPNRASLIKDLELIVYYVRDRQVSASFAVIDINHYERLQNNFGQETCDKLHSHVGQLCKLKLRSEDTIGTLSDRMMGMILVDAPQEQARMVLNRLRWAIGVSGMPAKKEELLAQVNIGFTQIDGKISETDLLEKCESFVKQMREKVANSVQLVITHERREMDDRRKVSKPVAVERRRMSRRKSRIKQVG